MTTSCKVCEIPADVLTSLPFRGPKKVGPALTALGYPVSSWDVRRHNEHVTRDAAVLTVKTAEVLVPKTLEEGVTGFADRFAASADVTGNRTFFEQQGVPTPRTGFKGASVQVVSRQPIRDENGDPTGDYADVRSWVRAVPEAEPLPQVDFDELRKKLVSYLPDQKKWAPPTTEELSYLVCPSDQQIGKPGTQEAIANFLGGVRRHRQEIDHLKDRGYNIKRVGKLNGGDGCEAFTSSFSNQHFVAEHDLTQQLELNIDSNLTALQTLRCPGEWIVDDDYVGSNHGLWTRQNGSKDSTTNPNDNIDIHIGNEMRRLVRVGGMDDVTVTTATRHFIAKEYSGTLVYLSHMYQEKGSGPHEQKVVSAAQRQVLGNLDELHKLRIVLAGHYHHDYRIEQSGWTVFGLAASEAQWSSDYLRTAFGVWSRPGVSGLLVGAALGGREYGHHQVL